MARTLLLEGKDVYPPPLFSLGRPAACLCLRAQFVNGPAVWAGYESPSNRGLALVTARVGTDRYNLSRSGLRSVQAADARGSLRAQLHG